MCIWRRKTDLYKVKSVKTSWNMDGAAHELKLCSRFAFWCEYVKADEDLWNEIEHRDSTMKLIFVAIQPRKYNFEMNITDRIVMFSNNTEGLGLIF